MPVTVAYRYKWHTGMCENTHHVVKYRYELYDMKMYTLGVKYIVVLGMCVYICDICVMCLYMHAYVIYMYIAYISIS